MQEIRGLPGAFVKAAKYQVARIDPAKRGMCTHHRESIILLQDGATIVYLLEARGKPCCDHHRYPPPTKPSKADPHQRT
jgi:hypothetical protein